MTFPLGSGIVRPGMRAVWTLAALLAAAHAWSATDVPVWHTLQGHNAESFQDLIKAYNRSQSDVRVVARAFDTPEALDQALSAAAKSKKLPALAQIGDRHILDEIAQRSYVQPFYE